MATLNIYQRVLAVAEAVMSVEKNSEVKAGSGSYKAVSDYDVVVAVKKAEAKFGVISIPISQELISTDVIKTTDKYGNEKATIHDIVKMTVKFVNTDDPTDHFSVEAYGRGIDTGDKGFGKASTYARKYCLLNAYKIATGEDPDKDASPENGTVDEKPMAAPKAPTKKKVAELKADTLMENALLEARKAKTRDELKDVWEKYAPELKTNRRFVDEINRLKGEIEKANAQEELV